MLHTSFSLKDKRIIINNRIYRVPFLSLKDWATVKSIEIQLVDKDNLTISKDLLKLLWKFTKIKKFFIKKEQKYAIIKEFLNINNFESKLIDTRQTTKTFNTDFNEYVLSVMHDIADRYKISPFEVLNMPYIAIKQLQEVHKKDRYIEEYYNCKSNIEMLKDKDSNYLKIEKNKQIQNCKNRMNEILCIINKNTNKNDQFINEEKEAFEKLRILQNKFKGNKND